MYTERGMGKEQRDVSSVFEKGAAYLFPMWVSKGILAFVFIYAGVTKIGDAKAFAGIIGSYGLLPESIVLPAALLLPPLEILVGIGILFGRKSALWCALLLLINFIIVLSYGLWLGLDIDCGCFEVGSLQYEVFKGLKGALCRDLLLLVPLGYLVWQSSRSMQTQCLGSETNQRRGC